LRSFIAIEIPELVKREISDKTLTLLEKHRPSLRWVPAEKMHLTIKFLGDFPESKIPLLSQSLALKCREYPVSEIMVSGVGCFPKMSRPAVIWIGLKMPVSLNNLQVQIEKAAASFGIPVEKKPFSPHLTIARVSPNITADEIKNLTRDIIELKNQLGDVILGRFTAGKLTLFKSDLNPSGALYTTLFEAPLGQFSPV